MELVARNCCGGWIAHSDQVDVSADSRIQEVEFSILQLSLDIFRSGFIRGHLEGRATENFEVSKVSLREVVNT